jgi:hypothetical protein
MSIIKMMDRLNQNGGFIGTALSADCYGIDMAKLEVSSFQSPLEL